MTALPFIDVFGFWIGIFLTFCILSFLYKDNPFYKFAEHLFIGVSIGYVVMQQYYNSLRPKLVEELGKASITPDLHWLALIPLALCLMMLAKALSRRLAWVGRFPIAFVVALYAGMQVKAKAESDVGNQIVRAGADLDREKVDLSTAPPETLRQLPGFTPAVAAKVVEHRATHPLSSIDDLEKIPTLSAGEREFLAESRGTVQGIDAQAAVKPGGRYWFGIFSNVLLLLGTISALLYFYYSAAHKGVLGGVTRFGVWILMIGFGASFGYTVQGRIALAIGRAHEIKGLTMDPADAAAVQGPIVAIASMAIIAGGIVLWEVLGRRRPGSGGGGGSH